LPSDIKKTVIALLVSCVFTLISSYFNGDFEAIGFNDPFTVSIYAILTLLIAWLTWDLFRGKAIKLPLLLAGTTILASLIWDISEFGFGMTQLLYVLELLLFGIHVMWILLIVWLIWNLFRRVDIKPILVFAGVIMLAALIWDISNFGFGMVQLFDILELLMFAAAYFFVSTKETKSWYSEETLKQAEY
jgi:hypothetical protein